MSGNCCTLAALLAPCDEGRFLTESLGRCPLRVEGDGDKFSQLITWKQIEWFLSRGGGNLTRVRVSNLDTVLPESSYSRVGISGGTHIMVGELTKLLRQGATIQIDGAEEVFGPLATLTDAVADRLQVTVNATVHASLCELATPQFSRNDHDVIVAQISGGALWQVQAPGFRAAESQTPEHAPGHDPEMQQRQPALEQGQLLYIPKEWWRCERPMNQASLALRLSFRNPTGLDILGRLVDQLSLIRAMRMDCPRFADEATQSRYLTLIQRELLAACTEPGLLLGFFKDMRAMADPRKLVGMPSVDMDSATLPLDTVIAPLVKYSDSLMPATNSDAVEVFFEGKVIVLAADAGAVLGSLVREGTGKTIRQLILMCGGETAETWLPLAISKLLEHGLITTGG